MTQGKQSDADRRTIVVVGATSDVGRVVAAKLSAAGHDVRGVARSLGVALNNQAALNRAMSAADSAYLMIPFDMSVPDLHEYERQIVGNLIAALKESRIRRVVLLSGLNAHLKMGTSLGAAEMEDRLDALGLPEVTRLRAGFFNENLMKGMAFPAQAATGTFATPFRGDLPMPMIAARDIGARAADLLGASTWTGRPVIELHGGGYYTFEDVTSILGAALRRDVTYRTVPLDEARAGMIVGGMSASFADALIETAASFNREERWALESPSPQNTTSTSFERWARERVSLPQRGHRAVTHDGAAAAPAD